MFDHPSATHSPVGPHAPLDIVASSTPSHHRPVGAAMKVSGVLGNALMRPGVESGASVVDHRWHLVRLLLSPFASQTQTAINGELTNRQ
jgi:hypothetical protein